ncbi:hypothetical protein JOY44_10810 [Phormidium sp. CLA17]|uniref:hypothetical protein n=1 Tax=Leptolyngbya sp. Cla-17 TaxID=2803751 RepID=UPI0014916FAC|nr:hypothetical protein [Leptolyngbya sp. Cla-17]MBM0742106.1 hypothetical protein [Leptolyngbya sp. Cla-17]
MQFFPLIDHFFTQVRKFPVQLWIGLIVLLPLGTGVAGVWLLSKMDDVECQTVWLSPLATESTRLYCAQVSADRRTATDLGEAIKLADSISLSHPLRQDSDRLIQQWSNRLLEMGDTAFQNGKLDDAIMMLESIPDSTTLRKSATQKIEQWQETWKQAEGIFQKVQDAIAADNLLIAFAEARTLLKINNEYWRTTRFQDVVNQIQTAKENKSAQAAADRKKGIASAPFGRTRPLTTTELMSRWQKEQDQEAVGHLQKARSLAATGETSRLRDAIAEAQMVLSGTAQYTEAQQLIKDWNNQIEIIEDRPALNRATALARKGDIASLEAAITEANSIYFGRTLYREAQANIDQWSAQVRQLYDRQYAQELPPNNSQPSRDPSFYQIPATP